MHGASQGGHDISIRNCHPILSSCHSGLLPPLTVPPLPSPHHPCLMASHLVLAAANSEWRIPRTLGLSNNVDGTNADRESDESRSDERVDTRSVPRSVPRSMPSIGDGPRATCGNPRIERCGPACHPLQVYPGSGLHLDDSHQSSHQLTA